MHKLKSKSNLFCRKNIIDASNKPKADGAKGTAIDATMSNVIDKESIIV